MITLINPTLPYGFAKAHTLLLEDDGTQLVLWVAETTPPGALSEVNRLSRPRRQGSFQKVEIG